MYEWMTTYFFQMNRNLGPGQPLDTAVAKRQGQLKRYILCQMIRRSLSQVQDEQ